MEKQKKKDGNFMEKIAAFIVDKRNLFFLIYLVACIFSVISMNWKEVESDITVYLDEECETRQGIETMKEHFATFATARVMLSSVTYEEAKEVYDLITEVEGVTMVDFNNSPEYYKDSYALLSISFDGEVLDARTIASMETIRGLVQGYDHCIDTNIGYDENAEIMKEMGLILVMGVIVIVIVLTLTSTAYMEVPILMMTFGVAALLGMGTNFLVGKISFISDSVAVLLQLAMAIDYAIILAHRYSAEHELLPAREACIKALSKAIPEISASSLTTISGLAALGFMNFGIGLDLAVVLIKGILLSLMSVFTFMPGILIVFTPMLDKTKHKKLLPNVTFIGKFCVKCRWVIAPVFILCLFGAFYFSSKCPYCFSYTDLRRTHMSQRQQNYFKINDTFGTSNLVAILVPTGDYEAEAAILEQLEACEEVKSCMGLANTELMDGTVMTDALNPRELSELLGLDYEMVEMLYTMYVVEDGSYGQLLDMDSLRIPVFDLFCYLKDTLDKSGVKLEGDMAEMVEMLDMLDMARDQLQTDAYSRMVVYLNVPEEGEDTYAFLDKVHEIADKYYSDPIFVVGNSTSSRDLASTFEKDNLIISTFSIFFVVVVLLFTFKSTALPILLIIVIQGSIWINFAIPTFTKESLYFLGYLIVNAIQMGTNIDYAIVMSSHFREQKEKMPAKEAIVIAVYKAFPTVFTSGVIMSSTGFLLGAIGTQPVTAILGECIGRGTAISMVLVLLVLPCILVVGDKFIEKTSFEMKGIPISEFEEKGIMRVNGHMRGYVEGVIEGNVDGIVYGRVHAAVSSNKMPIEVEEYDEYAVRKARRAFRHEEKEKDKFQDTSLVSKMKETMEQEGGTSDAEE